MKKNLIKGFGLLLCATIIVIGCTNDEASVKTDSQSRDIMLKSGDGISEFKVYFDETYGRDYRVDTTPIEVTEDGESFTAYKVALTGDKEGYILETPRDGNYYYEHNIAERTVTESHYAERGLENVITDLSGDLYYQYHGFNPILIHDDPIVAPAKFWGWKLTNYGGCGPNSNGEYFAGVKVTHYIMGIGGSEQQLMNGTTPVTTPCDPGPPVSYTPYTGDLHF